MDAHASLPTAPTLADDRQAQTIVADDLATQAAKSQLRFITCGSVDDGKSTLIGRILFEAKSLFDDQLSTLERDSARHGTQGDNLDFALLVDGLAAEREQGITIDVAYRFFETTKRKFIVADTPGHEQYTRNMATGASTADLAIVLIDARKGVLTQTRRHSLILSLLGVKRVVLAVNKIDLVDFSQSVFEEILAAYRAFAAPLGFDDIVAIPLSARDGDNVTALSERMPWYRGPALLPYLETVDLDAEVGKRPFRFPVQLVSRPDAQFRGYAGLVVSGRIRKGDAILALPSGRSSRVARIVTADGDLAEAIADQSVTLTMEDEIDISRGDILVSPDSPAKIGTGLETKIVWMAERTLAVDDRVFVKSGAKSVAARVVDIVERIDINSGAPSPATKLGLNDIGSVVLALEAPLAVDPYAQNRDTGGLIVVDRQSFATLGIGMISGVRQSDYRPSDVPENLDESFAAMEGLPPRQQALAVETHRRSIMKAVSWRFLGTLNTVLLAWLFTDDIGVSAAIGGTEALTKTALYYFHERVWAKARFGLK